MTRPTLTKAERLDRISRQVLDNGEASLDDLAEQLSVSRMTIHRDLEVLETRGVLRKIRNGATAQPSSAFESNVEFRMARAVAAKERLAAHAALLIEPGDVILLDEATTLLPMIPHLAGIDDLTVVSNFLPIQAAVSRMTSVRLIGLCGEYVRQFDTFSGPLCEQSVRQLRINRYFTSTTAIAADGAFHPNSAIAGVKRAMMRASVCKYLLADSAKFDRTALHRFADLDEFDRIFTDAAPGRARAVEIGSAIDRVVVVPPAEQSSS
jgi:DeoR/GlpR family transcriptional regulator of sugar metabolism